MDVFVQVTKLTKIGLTGTVSGTYRSFGLSHALFIENFLEVAVCMDGMLVIIEIAQVNK